MRHNRLIRCPQMNETFVLPSQAMASLAAYYLDTDTNGYYVEQLTASDYITS